MDTPDRLAAITKRYLHEMEEHGARDVVLAYCVQTDGNLWKIRMEGNGSPWAQHALAVEIAENLLPSGGNEEDSQTEVGDEGEGLA